jgi:hypothetical protein
MLILYCLLFLSPRAAPVESSQQPCKVWRYDSTSPEAHKNMSQICADSRVDDSLDDLKQQNYLRNGLLAQNPNPFSIDFTCEAGVDATKCRQAQAGFISAGNRIAQILAFPQTVKVKAIFKSFCNGNREGCTLADTLGQASPAAYFSARPESENESWYFYPQALVKQVMHDIQLVYNDYDILAEFNSDFNFWFANETTQAITPDQTDFEFVVSHEFTHGLGFDTAWSQWGSLFPSAASARSYLAPLPFISGSTVSTASVPNWQPLTIFDRFTTDSNSRPIIDRAKEIFSYSMYMLC